jgi:murein DD-endopeptidase MepM/ murein hydrolase activator NlpD
MNRLQYRTYKLGNLVISKIDNEIAFLYKGKKKLYSKLIRTDGLLSGVRKFIILVSILLVTGTAFYIYNNITFHSNESTESTEIKENAIAVDVDKDEQKKNDILSSKTTDYPDQQKFVKLTIREHIVKDKDTISGLAKEYGVSMDTICGSNRLNSYDFIHTGKKLKIPNKDGVLHEITKGQNIYDIAKYFKVPVEKIFAQNNAKNFDFISVGDIIFIPDAKPLNIMPGFLWPAVIWRITCRFGWRRDPFNGMRQFHQGLDIRSNYQNIRATKFGRVTYTGWLGKYGNVIIIAHPGGWKSVYGHLSRIFVRQGQEVRQGQWIGKSGNTGYSTGPHLHFELIKDGVPKNPYNYLKYN